MGKQCVLHILSVCSLTYPERNAHAPCCYLWPVCCKYFFFRLKSKNNTIFRKESCFCFSLQLSSETFLILRRTERDMIRNVYRSSCKVPVILVRFEWNLDFIDRGSKNTQIFNFVKFLPVGAEVFHADRQADRQTDRQDEANKFL